MSGEFPSEVRLRRWLRLVTSITVSRSRRGRDGCRRGQIPARSDRRKRSAFPSLFFFFECGTQELGKLDAGFGRGSSTSFNLFGSNSPKRASAWLWPASARPVRGRRPRLQSSLFQCRGACSADLYCEANLGDHSNRLVFPARVLTLDPPLFLRRVFRFPPADRIFFSRHTDNIRRCATTTSFIQKVLAEHLAFGSLFPFSPIFTPSFVCRPSTNSCARAAAKCASSRNHLPWTAIRFVAAFACRS